MANLLSAAKTHASVVDFNFYSTNVGSGEVVAVSIGMLLRAGGRRSLARPKTGSSGFRATLAAVSGSALMLAILISPCSLSAQDAGSESSDRERMIADRFMTVLLRRPRPGTSLDRVYGFHVQDDSLDELVESLDVPADAPDAGPKTMILGLIQLQRGKPSLAAEALQEAEERMPGDAACSYYLGRALLAIGQTEQAAAAMERAIERKPARNEALPIFTELGRIYGRAGLGEKALAVWTKLEKLFPGDARVGGQIARTLAEEGNVEEALKRYQKLATSARSEEDKVAFAVQAAEMRRRLGQSEEATADLESILARLRPGSWLYSDVRNRIEDGFLKSGDFDGLANYYQKRLEKDSDNLEMQIRLGRILVSAGRLDESKKVLEQAADRAPDKPEVRLALIDVLLEKGDIASAASQFEALAEDDPENPDYLLRWGQILLEDSKVELAERRKNAAEVWGRLADARKEDAVTLSQIADKMRSIDQKDQAIELYRSAIEVDPESSQYREYLGEYLHSLDRKDEALEVWESIAADDRRNRDSLVRLAEVFATFDLGDRSLEAWAEAAKLDLTFTQELRYANKLRDAKQYDEALARLDVAEAIAETPDEQEQLFKDRITTYQQAGTLSDQIAKLQGQEATPENLRRLAVMHQAAGQLTDAAVVIEKAIEKAPENVDVLIVAADIAERQNRFADAAQKFRELSGIDTRFRSNYLQRVASLQMRLGQVDDAMQTCEELIETNPASPESYQFKARTAFRAGRDDDAITALRRAMTVAPRDNGPRMMLAGAYADRYRTDEAIELYWQAMQNEAKADGQISLISRIAPLYDRRGDIDTLIQRIEEMRKEDVDARTSQLMVASAHEAVRDYGAARAALDRLLAEQPRDVQLLESMVRLCDSADEVVLAAEFQQRIVDLADTPENRFKLVQLKLDGGLIDVATALSERVSLASDPERLGSMVRSAATRGDTQTAIAICREATRLDPTLWDIRLYLAQMLLHDNGDQRAKHREEAISLTDEIRDLDLPLDATPPTSRSRQSPNPTQRRPASVNRASPQYWSNSGYELARNFRVGNYARSYSSSVSTPLTQPTSFGHARVVAAGLQLIAAIQASPSTDAGKAARDVLDSKFTLSDVDELEDAGAIWEYRALLSIMRYMAPRTGPSAALTSDDERERQQSLTWKLAELDPEYGSAGLVSMLLGRVPEIRRLESEAENDGSDANKQGDASAESTDADGEVEKSKPKIEPLSDDQLDLVARLYEQAKVREQASNASPTRNTVLAYPFILQNEYRFAGDPARADQYTVEPPGPEASAAEVYSAMGFYLRFGQDEEAEALVSRLGEASRRPSQSNSGLSSSSINGSAGSLGSTGDRGAEFVEKHRLELLDAFIANAVNQATQSRRRTSSLSTGTARAYALMPSGGYTSITIKAPLSTTLLNQGVINELAGVLPKDSKQGNARPTSIKVPKDLIEHLESDVESAPPHEQKTRKVLAAFAHWWNGEPQGCYEGLIELCEKYPDDVDLQIERARLASELGQPRVALDALDSFDPLDSQMLVRKEMAAMNLASQLGDVDRARQSAERLFGMRMDTNTQLALADQLRRLGLDSQAAAVRQRLRGGRSQSESVDIQIANAFLAGDDKEAAAEVAYNLMRKLNSGRNRSSNADYYRRQAVSILSSAGRLEKLIEQGERRVKSSPKSTRARAELAELYTAAGRSEDADKLWDQVATTQPNDPRQMMARAASLARAKKHKEAALMYLDAFEKQPQLFSNSYYQMTRSVQSAKMQDEMYERLVKMRPEVIPEYRIDELLRIDRNSAFSDAKRKFVAHVLKHPRINSQLYSLVRSVPNEELQKIPEYREAIVGAVCADDAFQPQSTFWRVSSRSSGGTAIGPLDRVVELLVGDEKARERFTKAATEAQSKDVSKPTALFLTALVEAENTDQRADAMQQVRGLLKPNAEKSDSEQGLPFTISGGLLWQAGQRIEKYDDVEDKPNLLVELYEASTRDPAVGRTGDDLRFSVVNRLIDSYAKAGMTTKARRYLLDAYESTDHSDQNQYNPGYGDYQELSTFYSIGNKLAEMGCPIDALAIYRRAISEPEKFERAKTWGGSTTVEQFEKAAEKAAKKVDSVAATAHLQRLMELLGNAEDEDDEPEHELDLLDLPIRLAVNENSTPGLQLAIQYALDSDEGKEALDALYQQLADVTDDVPEHHWSLPAARLMIATVRDPESIEPISEKLIDRLPPVEEIEKAADTPSALKYKPLWDLFSAAQFCMASDLDEAKEAGSEICDYLEVVGQVTREANAQLALASLTGSGIESLLAMLDAIDKTRKPGQPLGSDAANSCLRIAKSAAKQGHVELSCRALALALGQGPPLRQVGTVSDAFAIQTSRSRPNPRDDNGLGVIVADVCGIADDFSDATGHQIGQREPSEEAKATRVEDVDGALKAIALSFQQVVLPKDRDGAVFPYAKPIVSTSNYDPFRGNDIPDPQSLSIALGRAANLSGRTEAVIAEIRERMSQKAGDQQKLASVFVDVARAARDEELLAEALEAFVASVDSELPAADAVGIVRGSPTSITSQMQQDSYRKSVLVNAVLHAAWPIVFEKDFPSKQLKGRARGLFERTAALIESDGYTSQRHRVLLKRLREEMITSAAETGDSSGFAKLLKAEMASLAQQYASYTGTTDYEKRALDELLMGLMDKGLINKTPSFVRKLILRAREKRLDYQSGTLAIVCIEIRKLPPEQQYEVLREITLGTDDDRSVAHWGAFVRYSEPPEFSERQVPRLEAARQLPTCTSDVPVADTLLLLADLAAELGKSETLASELAEISKQQGDDADLAAKLTMLAAVAKSDSGIDSTEALQAVDQMMETVAARISENKPTKNDRELKFPMLEWYVVLRALDVGWPSSKAEPIMRDVKAYAVRSQQNLLVSAISRVIALNGIGRTAGGTTASPLKHFAVVSLPPRFHPDLQNLKPLFAINDEGWLSGTSGYGATQLMFKYPLTGKFTVSAEIKDGGWGESDIAYGGLLYQPAGFNKKARVKALIGATVEFPVPSIEHNKPNVEAVKVTSDEVLGLCNGETYVTDIKTASYPWAAVTHHLYRTTQLRDIRIEGEVEIPREVDMIDPTMRGWAVMNVGRTGPDPRLPIGPKQDRDEIVAKRKAADEALAKGRPDSVWSVKDGELGYPSPEDESTYNPDSQLQYLRPLFDGETVELSFWWEWGKGEVHPTVGRLALMMTRKGVVPKWLRCNGDLTSRDYVILSALDPPASSLGTENLPKDKSWNTLTMTRKGDSVEVELNHEPLAVVPVTDTSRPGVYRRKGFDARIQSMKLTGDWPTEVPTELMERAK